MEKYQINQALTDFYQGCYVLFAIVKLDTNNNFVYDHCLEFGRYVINKSLKIVLDSDYNVVAVYDIVGIKASI